MTWEVIAFESNREEKPVEVFIKSQSRKTIAKVANEIDLLEKHGNLLRMPHSKMISKKLFELRIRGKEEIRIIYTFKSHKIYLLHAFKKKTQRTPAKEINTAIRRIDMI